MSPPMEKKGRKAARQPSAVGAFTIPDFCRAHGAISEAFFHKLVREGRGPKLMRVGTRVMVSVESAERWRRAREREATTTVRDTATETAAA